MNDKTRALLGDHEAAKRLTDAGVLLPCAHCGEASYFQLRLSFEKGKKRFGKRYDHCKICCGYCTETVRGVGLGKDDARKEVMLTWNTRAPVLSVGEMEMLEGME